MTIYIPYGDQTLEAAIDWARMLGTIDIAETEALADIDAALRDALTNPIGLDHSMADQLPADGSIVIIVSDSFRKTGVDRLLPTLCAYLNMHGVADERISFLFATGSHRPPTPEEQALILGEAICARFKNRIFAHDPRDTAGLVYRGTTTRGTPVYINRRAAEAACVIATGAVVLHYFGGFGGGRKSIVPGIAGLDTIAANHALNLDPAEDRLNPDVAIGQTRGNPVAEDMLEAALLTRCDFLINTVLNRQDAIAGLFCGDLERAHVAACDTARDLYAVEITEPADLVIASAGSARNFVQSHKSLYNAFQAMRPGGRIILAARAPEGFGGERFQAWLALGTRDAIITELRKCAEINGQTALSTREKSQNTLFISDLSEAQITTLGGRKSADLAEALFVARTELAAAGIAHPTCYVMPSAGVTVPFLKPTET